MILVTGASGFVGQHLVRFLSGRGAQVRALYNSHVPDSKLSSLINVTWQQCDLLDIYAVEEVMQGISQVYHCAAIVSFDPARRDEMLHFNVESTAHLADIALEQGVEKLLHLSSVAALGRSGVAKEITEEEEWGESGYNSAYGLSKHLAEMEVWRAIGEGLNAVIINPGIILGAGDWNEGSPKLMKLANDEFPFYTDGVTSWVDLADVVQLMYELMQSDITAERFICSAGNYNYKDIFTQMAAALSKKRPHIHAGKLMTSLAWRWSALRSKLSGKSPLLTRETAMNGQGISLYNNQKLLNALPGFSYRNMDETIDDMARSFKTTYVKK